MESKTPRNEDDNSPITGVPRYFQTSDMGLAATLSASGFKLARINKDNPRRVVFLFINTPELKKQVEKFWASELKLSATILLEHIRLIKARIYGESSNRSINNEYEYEYGKSNELNSSRNSNSK